jgi:hypothetical protein
MEIDNKSDDELELERLVFGDSEGIKKRLTKQKSDEKSKQPTDLEHLEDNQVNFPRGRSDISYSSSTRASRLSLPEMLQMKKVMLTLGRRGTIATTIH